MNNDYKNRIASELNNCLTETSFPAGNKKTGKVRDQYDLGDKIVLITTKFALWRDQKATYTQLFRRMGVMISCHFN